MRAPNEVKQWIKYCQQSPEDRDCFICPYCIKCVDALLADALAYIELLEMEVQNATCNNPSAR